MPLKPSEIRKILIVSLTNIGDVILTFPVMDVLIRDFPAAKISVVVGPKAESLLRGNPRFDQVYVFDKHQTAVRTLFWIGQLRRERFDLIVDLRNTAIPFLVPCRWRTPLWTLNHPSVHMTQKHLNRLQLVYRAVSQSAPPRRCVFIPAQDEEAAGRLLKNTGGAIPRYAVIAPGAADEAKRWTQRGFAEICYNLIRKYYLDIVFVGDENDRHFAQRITEIISENTLNLCGETTLPQLAAVLKGCVLAVGNDSAPMHLASYLDVPVLALFGPTDGRNYGPWGGGGRYLQKNQDCAACRNPRGSSRHTCMQAITSTDVLGAFQITDDGVRFLTP